MPGGWEMMKAMVRAMSIGERTGEMVSMRSPKLSSS